jgi:DMSO/TMAO reductase YedYZ heme-binding membrane subunit
LVFIALHVASTVFDTYVTIPVMAAFIPLTSSYRGLDVSLGAVGFDLLLIVLVSSLLRQFIPNDLWRRLHYLTYIAAPFAFLHVLLLGTDARRGSHWMLLVLLICGASSLVAVIARVVRQRRLRELNRRRVGTVRKLP